MNEEYTGTLRRRVESLTPSQQHALALAISHHAVPASSRLVAFIEYEDGQRPSDESLREFLAPRLPQYMIPARFMFLAQLPRNPAGKIDRRALANVDTTWSSRCR